MMNINEHLAINVMGWEKYPDPKYPDNPNSYRDSDNNFSTLDFVWNPTENIEQAFMCLDKMPDINKGWSLNKNDSSQKHQCRIFEWKQATTKKFIGEGAAKEKSKAISLACAKATGWEQ